MRLIKAGCEKGFNNGEYVRPRQRLSLRSSAPAAGDRDKAAAKPGQGIRVPAAASLSLAMTCRPDPAPGRLGDMTAQRVAVIGSGASGLASIKCCLEEGLEPVCFERSDDIGGLWRFQREAHEPATLCSGPARPGEEAWSAQVLQRLCNERFYLLQENPEEGRASIYRSVIINSSKEMMCFSDYPIPDHFPNFMHNSQVLEYFRMYAKAFDLLKYIRFKTTVCSVKKRPDFPTSGQWEVVTECGGKEETTVFDGVMVCTGHHTNAYLPLDSFPGIEKFKGQYLHSRDYKNPNSFTGKRVIVIGIGNSGADLAVETSHVAKQVGTNNHFPLPHQGSCWGTHLAHQSRLRARSLVHRHSGALSQHPTVNDELPNRIISGVVKVKGNVKEFTETAAIFEDGSKEEDIDAVIFATGYSFAFPFLDDSVKVVNNKVSLYKKVFPPNLEKPTLAIIGLIQPLGAIMPISELQGRWVTQVFKGTKTLPSQSEMKREIAKAQEEIAKRYVDTPRHTIQGDYIDTMEELAVLVGVKPNLLHLAFTDPKLALELLVGPCTPIHYRLQGPGKWAEARKAILNTKSRVRKPLMTRAVESSDPANPVVTMARFMTAIVFFAILMAYF
ncbi:Dimethylaniline monooxygenase [N-oxide-forming] 5 [Galemys pyrenaicus]|uniref:Flavin-containing monooxygenase n=1 Tax=Galemys pyrenaicus TaxID=202257 RepID=A0A8J6DR40_GALPY|nr:Dimethylaniline monooxygenase [N-oxide-forming] 5 [Galemys pyrenaicus]